MDVYVNRMLLIILKFLIFVFACKIIKRRVQCDEFIMSHTICISGNVNDARYLYFI